MRYDYEKAEQKLVLATRMAKDYVDAHYYLGLVCFALKKYQDSKSSVDSVLKLEPDHQGARELFDELGGVGLCDN